MSEYWKSTERYWCKHCKLFVKDTKLERTNHDLTPRHQGNLKRFVRDLHKTNEREVRDAQRAKDEVARLNGVVSGSSSASRSNVPATYNTASTGPRPKQSAQDTHKAQLQQLVDLGVSLPDEFRKELSMTGEWQTVSERVIETGTLGQGNTDALGYGVRKRGNPEDAEDEEESLTKRRRWEHTHKTYKTEDDGTLDELLKMKVEKNDLSVKNEPEMELSPPSNTGPSDLHGSQDAKVKADYPTLKQEPSDGANVASSLSSVPNNVPKAAEGIEAVVFKKRGKKNIRQK